MLQFPDRVRILGASIDPLSLGQTLDRTIRFIETDSFAHISGINADKVLQIRDNPELAEIIERCEIVSADGISILLAARWLGISVPERVTGIDLMLELCRIAAEKRYSVFLFGSTNEIVSKTKSNLERAYPGILITGTHHGFVEVNKIDPLIKELRRLKPKLVFVGITSPKKELIIELFRKKVLNSVFVGVGGSFDVISGELSRAPRWLQKIHLEWAYRMVQEPKRLMRRYLIGNMKFLILLLRTRQKDQKSND